MFENYDPNEEEMGIPDEEIEMIESQASEEEPSEEMESFTDLEEQE